MAIPRTLALVALLTACAAEPRWTLAHGGDSLARQGPWSMELVDEAGRSLPTFEHRGRTWVLGEPGARYLLRVRNGTGRRVEVVATVDGNDVIDGRKGAFDRRGYLVEPYGELTIDGFRISASSVAAFRFGSVASSYAAAKGDARDVGVIGVAVFPERWEPPPPTPWPWRQQAPSEEDESASSAAPRPEAAPAPAERGAPQKSAGGSALRDDARARPGLGTRFGEAHGSPVYEVPFERASSQPAAILSLRYDDRRGLLAAGIDLDRWGWARDDEAWRREHANPFRASGAYAEPPPGWRGY